MSNLDDYETGALEGKLPTYKRWWQFWKPRYVSVSLGRYERIGDVVHVTITVGTIFLSGYSRKGRLQGQISGLPFAKGEVES